MNLVPVTMEHLHIIKDWRNKHINSLRTPYLINDDMQDVFYRDVICNRLSNSRYWSVMDDKNVFDGMIGVQKIEWENSLGELSFFLNPGTYDNDKWTSVMDLLVTQCFYHMNLHSVYLEIYECNNWIKFFLNYSFLDYMKKIEQSNVTLPCRKFYEGKYYNSTIITIVNV